MGQPADPFEVFYSFIKNDEVFMHSLTRFSLFAFIFYDEKLHPELHRHLSANFAYLDEATGAALLFIAPVQDIKVHVLRTQRRDYAQQFLENVYNSKIDMSHKSFYHWGQSQEKLKEKEKFNRVILEALGYSSEEPIIVVCTSPTDFGYVGMRTSADLINSQLIKIAKIAEEISYQNTSNNLILKILTSDLSDKINLLHTGEAAVIEASIAEKLNPILDFVFTKDNSILRQAILGYKDKFEALVSRENTAVPVDEEEVHLAEFTNNLMDLISVRISNISLKRWKAKNDLDSETAIQQLAKACLASKYLKYWDMKSLSILRSSVDTLELFQKKDISEEDFGATLVTIGICVAFEREMNSSYGHFLRQGAGVELPLFYWRHQPGLGNISISNLNSNISRRSNKTVWWAPSLGQLRLSVEECTQSNSDYLTEKIKDTFTTEVNQLWKSFVRIRNPAAHGTYLLWKDVEELLQNLVKWLELDSTQYLAYESFQEFKMTPEEEE